MPNRKTDAKSSIDMEEMQEAVSAHWIGDDLYVKYKNGREIRYTNASITEHQATGAFMNGKDLVLNTNMRVEFHEREVVEQ